MSSNRSIEKFVRHTLGCTCPDEVFEQIEHQEGDNRTEAYTRCITVGGRLLIYILETNDPLLVEAKLPSMLASGKDERDRRRLNRFRAVIATDHFEALSSIAQQLFRDFVGKDEKMHLHVIQMEDIAGL